MRRFWLAVALAAGCYRSSTTPPPRPPQESAHVPSATPMRPDRAAPARARRPAAASSDPEFAEVIATIASFRDAACSCTDKPCTEQVMSELDAWATGAGTLSNAPEPSDAAMKEMTDLVRQLTDCIAKVMQPPVMP